MLPTNVLPASSRLQLVIFIEYLIACQFFNDVLAPFAFILLNMTSFEISDSCGLIDE